ncbi:MAG: mechanosensitive ion channel family protein [Deltaproteobacteria bacterium]|nr:mechanosensitive ion channel family protein [Deltaproteobacteria bacterium]
MPLEVLDDLAKITYLGNTARAYAEALALLAGITLLLWTLEKIAAKRLRAFAQRTENRFDDYLVDLLDGLGLPVYGFIGLYLGTRSLVLAPSIARLLHIVFVAFLTIKIIQALSKAATFLVAQAYFRVGDEDPNRKSVVRNLGLVARIVLWTIGLVFLMDNMGIKITGVVAGLGIGGIAVALAAQTVLEDAFSSFSIFLDRPFEIGDFIIVGDFKGKVEHIGFKTTRLRSLDGEQLVFSNTDLTDSRIKNYKRMQERRIAFTIGVVYQTRLEKMKKIPGMIREIVDRAEGARFDRAHFSAYGPYSLDVEIVYYVLSADYNTYMDVQQEINYRIMEAFEREGIEFAYPTQTVFVERGGGEGSSRPS